MAGTSGLAGTAARLAGLAASPSAARLAVAAGGMAGAVRASLPVQPAPPQAGSSFDRAIDGLNRLPRPAFALGALGLFGYGVLDPAGFAARMAAFAAVPEPLWWLLGGVVGFYFGARELHHFREARSLAAGEAAAPAAAAEASADPAPEIAPARDAGTRPRPARGAARGSARTA